MLKEWSCEFCLCVCLFSYCFLMHQEVLRQTRVSRDVCILLAELHLTSFQALILASLSNSSHFSNLIPTWSSIESKIFFRMVKPRTGRPAWCHTRRPWWPRIERRPWRPKLRGAMQRRHWKQSLQADTEEAGSVPWMGWNCCIYIYNKCSQDPLCWFRKIIPPKHSYIV